MDTAYSLSDLASVMGNEGWGGNSAWIIILFVLIFGWGGFNRNNGELNQYATAASQQQILFNQQFDALGQKINQIGDGICSSTYSLNNAINGVNQNLGNAITTEGRNIQSQLCAINANIDNKFAALEKSSLEQRIADQAQQINQLSMAQMLCGIPKINTQAWGVYPYSTNGCGCNNI